MWTKAWKTSNEEVHHKMAMPIESGEAYYERIAQRTYDRAFPWERIFINYERWRAGEPLLRATPWRRRPA